MQSVQHESQNLLTEQTYIHLEVSNEYMITLSHLVEHPENRLERLPDELLYQNLQGSEHHINGVSRETHMGKIWESLTENQRRIMLIMSGIPLINIGYNCEYDPSINWKYKQNSTESFVGCPAKTLITNHCLRLFQQTYEQDQESSPNPIETFITYLWNQSNERDRLSLLSEAFRKNEILINKYPFLRNIEELEYDTRQTLFDLLRSIFD